MVRWIGAVLIAFSTIFGILYNVQSFNNIIGKFVWPHQRYAIEKLSSLGGKYHHQTLTHEIDGKNYEVLLDIVKEIAPHEPYEGVRGIESKTLLNYVAKPGDPSIPIMSAPISLLFSQEGAYYAVTTLPVLREWIRSRENSQFFAALLAIFLAGIISDFWARQGSFWLRRRQRDRASTRIRFALSFLIIVIFLILSYMWLPGQNLRLIFLPWLVWALFLILWLSRSIWILIDRENDIFEDRSNARIDINGENVDVHLAKYDHVDREVTRYRDLQWQIGIITWAIYYGITWLADQSHKFANLPEKAYFSGLFLTAFLSSVFLLFCEHSANANRRQRRELEVNLRLSERWQFTERGEDTNRLGFRFSVGAFLIAIWLPPLVLLVFRIHG